MLTLLGMAADPNCPTAQGETPLHLAVEESEQETIQVWVLCWRSLGQSGNYMIEVDRAHFTAQSVVGMKGQSPRHPWA